MISDGTLFSISQSFHKKIPTEDKMKHILYYPYEQKLALTKP
jgi:hypothetical protein